MAGAASSSSDRPSVRSAFLEAAAAAVALLADPAVATAWAEPSDLDGMTIGALAGHLSLSVTQVEAFLDGLAPDAPPPTDSGLLVDAPTYYGRVADLPDTDSELNRGVRARSDATAAAGPAGVATTAADALARLEVRLADEPDDRRVAVGHRPGEQLRLDEYLRTRCVELSVHLEDLALSIGHPVPSTPAATAIAVEVLVAAARHRHGDDAVLRALTRRRRDDVDALRVT